MSWWAKETETCWGGDFVHSLGLDVRTSWLQNPRVVFVAPTQAYARLTHAFASVDLITPTPHGPSFDFLGLVGDEFTKRDTHACLLKDLDERGPGFYKATNIKHDDLPAQFYENAKLFIDAAKSFGLHDCSFVQFSKELPIVAEFRVLVCQNKVVDLSPYLVVTPQGPKDYYSHLPKINSDGVAGFVERLIKSNPDLFSSAVIVDIARLDTGELVVLEANPVFSSMPYGIDLVLFLAALKVTYTQIDTPWVMDPYTIEQATKMRVLPVMVE